MQQVLRIADKHPNDAVELRARAHMTIGNALYQIDAYKVAEPQRQLENALALFKSAHSTSEDRSRAAYFLAWTYEPQRDFARAEALYLDGIDAARENFGEKSFVVAFGYEGLADMLRQQQRLPEAHEAIGKAIAIYEFVLGPRHGTVAFAKTNLALIEAASGRRAVTVGYFHPCGAGESHARNGPAAWGEWADDRSSRPTALAACRRR